MRSRLVQLQWKLQVEIFTGAICSFTYSWCNQRTRENLALRGSYAVQAQLQSPHLLSLALTPDLDHSPGFAHKLKCFVSTDCLINRTNTSKLAGLQMESTANYLINSWHLAYKGDKTKPINPLFLAQLNKPQRSPDPVPCYHARPCSYTHSHQPQHPGDHHSSQSFIGPRLLKVSFYQPK